jgi:hypothetical protein
MLYPRVESQDLRNLEQVHQRGLREAADIPCPALLKRDNEFYHVREGDLFSRFTLPDKYGLETA